jgi:hypothetical protein
MKNLVWSMKLGAAIGLLVASAALAAPTQSDDTSSAVVLLNDVVPARVKPPEHWIGVSCRAPLPEFLREHLDMPDSRGVLVVEVVPNGPAAKAGIAEFDILLTGNNQPLRSVVDLVQVVEEAAGKAVSFDLLRKGKHTTIEVKPEKNPHHGSPGGPDVKAPPYAELDQVYQWFEQHYPNAEPRMRLRFMHPGTILPADAPMHPSLPGSMSITIVKTGDKPTRITVKRGEDVWEVDEKGIDQLPKDVRPYVERMLQGIVVGPDVLIPRFDFMPDWVIQKKPPQPAQAGPPARDPMEEQMRRMNQRLDELQQMMEGLHDKAGPEKEK